MPGERALAPPGQCVDPPPPPGFGGDPATGKQAGLLQTMQRGIDRSLREVEGLPALELAGSLWVIGERTWEQVLTVCLLLCLISSITA